VVDDIAIGIDTLHHPIQDGGLSHAVDATQDIDMGIEIPDDVFLSTPERVNLYPLDIISKLLHSFRFLLGKNTTYF
jgi:hypothetical protein